MRHIEFLGMPGSGKTTALQLMLRMLRLNGVTVESLEQSALRALLGARGIVASTWLARHLPSRLRPGALRLLSGNASDRSRAFATFGAQHPDFIDYLFERDETRIAPGGRDELLVLLWLLSLVWWFQLATDEASGVDCCVSDHGFSQRGLSLLAYRDAPNTDPWERSVKEYFQCMPQPDVVVVPRAPLEVPWRAWRSVRRDIRRGSTGYRRPNSGPCPNGRSAVSSLGPSSSSAAVSG